MVTTSIIAQNITNLSDARYFAAWGIEYISFNMIPDSPYVIQEPAIREIKDWVEGPKCLIEANALEITDLADGHILSNVYQSLPLNKEVFYRISFQELIKGLVASKYIVKVDEKDLAAARNIDPQSILGCDLYLDTTGLPLESFKDWPKWGLVVQGSEEEKVGLKSFEGLDDLYELLMDED